MSWDEIYRSFLDNVRQTGWPEWVSTVAQVASVWYARKNNILVYPTGIVGVLLAAWVYFFVAHPPLYADGTLNIYYFAMSVYGWYNWVQKKDAGHYTYPISWCTGRERLTGLLLCAGSFGVLLLVLTHHTNSNTPVGDALVSATAVTSMWWMARRKIDNWLAWIASNLVAIPLNFYKGLMLFTLMYVLFLVMAWMGYREWKKQATHAAA